MFLESKWTSSFGWVHFFAFLKNEWRFQIIFVIINIKSKLLQKVKVY